MTDCTRELNELVYSGDRTRLMSTQPRQLPELVRRFTQDIYMCVYIQPDVAMYGDDDSPSTLPDVAMSRDGKGDWERVAGDQGTTVVFLSSLIANVHLCI